MPKHNNVIPNGHFHKQWQRRVKTWFDQAPKARKRRNLRAEKARRIFPRPVSGLLRPVVQCPTIRYNSRSRLGRGFTFEELKAAQINRRTARNIGIAVDHRRRNRSAESLDANVARLEKYKSKLVVFPRHPNRKNFKPKKGDAPAEAIKTAKQHTGQLFPIRHYPAKTFETRAITEEDKQSRPYWQLRNARAQARIVGVRNRKKNKEDDVKPAAAAE